MTEKVEVEEITQFKTLDGQVHATMQLAQAHALFLTLAASLAKSDIYWRDTNPEAIVKWIADNRLLVREFLDAIR